MSPFPVKDTNRNARQTQHWCALHPTPACAARWLRLLPGLTGLKFSLYVFQTLGEYIGSFHNRDHDPDIAAVHRFLGSRHAGAFKPLCESYYRKLRNVLPADIEASYDGGPLDNPHPPYYHEPPDKGAA